MISKSSRTQARSRSAAKTGLACIVDVETTGLSQYDEVIELGMLLFEYDALRGSVLETVDEYAGLREPTVPITPGAYAVHGISRRELAGKRLDYEKVERIFARSNFIIAHNAPFDRRFVAGLSETAAEKPWLCTMRGVDWYAKGCSCRKLQDLLAAFHIRQSRAHRALADVYGVLALLECQVGDKLILAELMQKAGLWTPE